MTLRLQEEQEHLLQLQTAKEQLRGECAIVKGKLRVVEEQLSSATSSVNQFAQKEAELQAKLF